MATFPKKHELGRPRSGIFFLDKETVYQLTNTNSLRLAILEMAQFVWKTKGLPLTYSHFLIIGALWFEHRKSSTQMKRLTNLALLRIPEEKFEFSLLMHEIKVLTN
jgi:predicted outer membrane lipoprotein